MEKINKLRDELHKVIDRGDSEESLRVSRELDIEIIRFMKRECEVKKIGFGFK